MADTMIKRTIEFRVFGENGESGFNPNSRDLPLFESGEIRSQLVGGDAAGSQLVGAVPVRAEQRVALLNPGPLQKGLPRDGQNHAPGRDLNARRIVANDRDVVPTDDTGASHVPDRTR